jgi:dTDP-glucose pyrophosphorylase
MMAKQTRLESLCIRRTATLWEAMMRLNEVSIGIVFVVDENMCLIGSLTDGDIRRALLAGGEFQSPVLPYMQCDVIVVSPGTGRAEVLDLMRGRFVEQIPIVDEAGTLLGLHVMREIIGGTERPNWAVIMAGGRGERLRPFTDTIPKPMLKIAGRPILERIVLHLVGCGIRSIFLAVNYLAEAVESHFEDGRKFGCKITYLREEITLGTGGALSLLPGKPTAPILVMNGDLVTNADVGAMFEQHDADGNMVTLATRDYAHQVPFGCLELEQGAVVSISEKPMIARPINAGIYVLAPKMLDFVPSNREFSIVNLLELAIEKGHRVGAFAISEEWMDIGHINQLRTARGGSATES